MRVFWPSDIANVSSQGVLVGWRNSPLDVIVISVLQDVEAHSVRNALQVGTLFRGNPHPMNQLLDRCGNLKLEVLGTLNGKQQGVEFDPSHLYATTVRKGRSPTIWCPDDIGITLQVLIFERPDPNRMQYLSLSPIPLTLGETRPEMDSDPHLVDDTVNRRRQNEQMLLEKLRLHTVVRYPRTKQELALPTIISQINCSHELDRLMQKNIGLVGVRTRRALSVGERVVESAANARDTLLRQAARVFWTLIWPVVAQFFLFLLMMLFKY